MKLGVALLGKHTEEVFAVKLGLPGQLRQASVYLSYVVQGQQEVTLIAILKYCVEVAQGIFGVARRFSKSSW